MNATEQRKHTTVTQSLEQRIASLELIVEQCIANDNSIIPTLLKAADRIETLERESASLKQTYSPLSPMATGN